MQVRSVRHTNFARGASARTSASTGVGWRATSSHAGALKTVKAGVGGRAPIKGRGDVEDCLEGDDPVS
jgi:hypothetical protein